MSATDDAADVLAAFVAIGENHPVLEQLSGAIIGHVAERTAPSGDPDPNVLAALRDAATGQLAELTELTEMPEMASSSLYVSVDYLELVERVGQAEAWVVLGKLKDLLG